MSAKQTLDQQRARHAWEVIQKLCAKKDSDYAKEFARQAKAMPTRIMNSGLAQALVFVKSKGKAPDLVNALSDWVMSRLSGQTKGSAAQNADLMTAIVERDSLFLRRATAEALAYLQWVNRFADAEGLSGDD